jgi:DNA-binding NtrC family response regulator
VQAKLLRVLEERRVKPVGADSERPVDVRVVAATPADLASSIASGQFRADLYYRLSVLAFELPALRSRREDIPLIVAELLRRRGIDPGTIEGPGLDRLKSHRWPGNVRELRNVIDRALVLSPGARTFGELKISLEASVGSGEAIGVRTDLPYKDAKDVVLEQFERTYLVELMGRHRDNLSAAARDAGVDRKHWRSLLKKHGLFDGPEDDA